MVVRGGGVGAFEAFPKRMDNREGKLGGPGKREGERGRNGMGRLRGGKGRIY